LLVLKSRRRRRRRVGGVFHQMKGSTLS
jgi:hypothetical protein